MPPAVISVATRRPTSASGPDATSRSTSSGRLFGVALGLTLLPLLVSGIALVVDVGNSYLPTADYAYTELLTRDVGHHQVLTGLFSRQEWNHPGPALYYLLALPYRLTGGASIGLHLGALLINAAAIAGMAGIARRRGGTPLMLLTLVGCGLLVRSLGIEVVGNPWNCFMPLLPFGLFLLLTWTLTCGETWALPVAAGVASFCVQTHVGYAPMAIPLLVWGGVWAGVIARRAGRTRSLTRSLVLAAAVLVVMWLPPAIDELMHSPGNLHRIARYFQHPGESTHSLGVGYGVVAGEFGLPPEWLTGARPPFGFVGDHLFAHSAPPAVLLIPFLAAAVVLWRRRLREPSRLAATTLLALGLGVLAVSRTIGRISAYRLQWTWVLAMIACLVTVWTGWLLISARRPQPGGRVLSRLCLVALTVLSGVNVISAIRAGDPQEYWTAVMGDLTPPAAAALPAGDGDVLVRYRSAAGHFIASGLVLGLERRGIAARVDPDPASRFGAHRIHRRGPVQAVLTVLADAQVLSPPPGARLVSYTGTLSLEELRRKEGRRQALNAARTAGTISAEEWIRRTTELGVNDALAVALTPD